MTTETTTINRNNFIDNLLELLPIETEQQLDENCWGIVGEMLGGFIINEEVIIYQSITKYTGKGDRTNDWYENVMETRQRIIKKNKMTKSMELTYKFLLDNKGTYYNQNQIHKLMGKYSYSTISNNLSKLTSMKYCYFKSPDKGVTTYMYDIEWYNDLLDETKSIVWN